MAEQSGSRIFTGSKVLGYVSTHVPFVARFIKNRGETLLCTSVGKWFHTYGCNKFRLLSISGQHPGPITCMSGDNFHVYSASENNIYAWRRGCELKHVYKGHRGAIHLMLPFGIHLISIDTKNELKVFDIKEESVFLEMTFKRDHFDISTVCHPPTYLNKILLGSRQGQLQLWNLRTSKLVYTFKGWKSGVVVLEPAPAVDVVAIALFNKKIILHNLRLDQTVVDFTHDWGNVATLSFRMDGVPVMVSGSSLGHIVMWNLEERRVMSTMTSAHSRKIVGMQCLMSEPLMVTNSPDNSLKLWIFDMPDGGARLLRIRAGHANPPNLVWHCEPTGENLLAAGNDSTLHIMNTVTETFNKNMGTATVRKKANKKKKGNKDANVLPPIVKLSSCMQRDKQWDSIATIHKNKCLVTTWSYNKIKMGDHKLVPPERAPGVHATCLTVTACGNFVVVGYHNGEVHKYNMQSGIHRGHYGEVLNKKLAHEGAVRGVESDLCNQRVMTVGADDKLKFWYFKSTKLPYHVMQLEESVNITKCHRESGLLALANEDFTITLIDIDTMNIVRQFEGHQGKINDIAFDTQSRWLISTSMDCTVCTWDIPSGQLVDIFSLKQPCTSLSMSPTGDYLATTHVGELGVFLWANRLLYEKVFLKPIDRQSLAEVPKIKLPTTAPEKPNIEDIGTIDIGEEPEYLSPLQISSELITLSNQPTSKWLNLLHLDTVKQRNKPKTPLTVPKSAPFFLPTVASLDLQFDLDEKDGDKETKLLIPESMSTLTVFAKKLVECKSEENYEKCIVKLKALSPAAIDAEVSSMSPDAGGTIEVLKQFLLMLNVMLKSNRDFELAQSYLSLFLKTHTKVISNHGELRDALDDVEESATQAWSRLQNNLLYNICVIKALKDM